MFPLLSEGDRSSDRHQHLLPFATNILRKGMGNWSRCWGLTQTLHADYPVWIIKRRIRLPAIIPVLFHFAFIRRVASQAQHAQFNTLPPAASSASASSWLPSGMPSHAICCLSVCRNERRNYLHFT